MKALGLDIGTTTISAVVVDCETKEVKKACTIKNPGFIWCRESWKKQQDPIRIFGKSQELLDQILREEPDIDVIGLTGQMHGIVYLDAEGNSISPLYTWQDGSGEQKCRDGKSVCEFLKEMYGVKMYTGYGLATYLYHIFTDQVPKSAAGLCTIADYVGMTLTGRKKPRLHSSHAAGLGLYDVRKNVFRRELWEEIHPGPDLFPEVTTEIRALGEYRKIPVCTAIGDNQASFLGAVKEIKDSVLVNMGTGGQVSVYADRDLEEEGIESRPFLKEGYLLVGASLCGGRAYAILAAFFVQCAREMGIREINPYSVMERFLQMEGPIEKLEVDTRFSGTREHPEWRGSIQNIGTENFTPAALTRGVLEGMAEELYQMYRKMERVAGERKRLIVSGNGLRKNPALQRIISRRFSMELQLAGQKEEAAYGAALAGWLGIEGANAWKPSS